MLTIDGSEGEGGGQILRTSLALALVTATPFRITRIRAGRRRPGLMRQHLAAVAAAQRVGAARVAGATLGSGELSFMPGRVVPGECHFSVGSAGSATLVCQTVLPALMLATGPSRLVLEGGTHNPFAPPFDFLQKTFLPLLNRMGPRIVARLERPGFYPAGGGRFSLTVEPAAELAPLELLERGPIVGRRARAVVAGLPRQIAERELRVIRQKLNLERECLRVEQVQEARGPGNVVMLEIESRQVTEVFSGFGRRGVRAEALAEALAAEAQRYLEAGVPVGERLADQLLLPLALAGSGSFRTLEPSSHTRSNIAAVRRFLDVGIAADRVSEHAWQVTVGPAGKAGVRTRRLCC